MFGLGLFELLLLAAIVVGVVLVVRALTRH